MKIYIIAQIVSGKNVVGYRLLDVESKDQNSKLKDYPLNNIKAVLSNKATADIIKNARLVNGEVTGTNGQLSRYAKITTNGELIGKSPLVVLNKIDNLGYTVSDYKGQVKKMKNSDAVEYARAQGIANGKVILSDGVEYISSISDSYEQISITTSKTGKASRVDLRIHIDSDAKSIEKHTETDLDTELQYNDVFSAMNGEQRAALKQYYTWYTVDVYRSLAKNVRLNLAPGKAEKLAQLRGIDKWQFAGVNDSYLEGRFNAKCELGHSLRYEYFAIPEDLAKDNNISAKDYNGYYLSGRAKSSAERMKENGAIVFGETCAGDFFNIAPEDMKKLVKTRKIMSEEIELTADIITNKTENEYINKCKFLYDTLKELGSTQEVVKVFGEKVGYTLLSFIKAAIPFPKSLVILAGDKIRENKELFFKSVLKNYMDTVDKILKADYNSTYALQGAKAYFEFMAQYGVEGDYMYDPIHDDKNSRRDIGAYNKSTRYTREKELRRILSNCGINWQSMKKFETMQKFTELVDKAIEISDKIVNYVENSEILLDKYPKDSYYKRIRLASDIRYFVEDPYKIEDDELIPIISTAYRSLSFSKAFSNENLFTKATKRMNGFKRSVICRTFDDMYDTFVKDVSTDEIVNKSIVLYEESIREQYEREKEAKKNKTAYLSLELTDKELLKTRPLICETTYEVVELIDKHIDKENISEDDTIELYGGTVIKMNIIESYKEMNRYGYSLACENYDIVAEQEERELKQLEEEAKRVEQEVAHQEESYEREAIEKEVEEFNKKHSTENEESKDEDKIKDEDKFKVLKDLLKNNKDDDDYGIKVAKSILSKNSNYSDLTSKQKWRIDDTIKRLSNGEFTSDSSNSNASDKKKLKDNKDVEKMVETLLDVSMECDEDKLKVIQNESKIAISIAETVNNRGEYSDKQLKHIKNAYEALKKNKMID